MNRSYADVLVGQADAAAVRHRLLEGDPPVFILCAATADVLSKHSRELVMQLRGSGVRVEFHLPDASDSVLQSTNRILADIPLDSLSSGDLPLARRLLVIDAGESLAMPEVASLRRLVNGLRASVLRVIVLVNAPRARLEHLPLTELGGLAAVWDLEGSQDSVQEPAQWDIPPALEVAVAGAASLPQSPDADDIFANLSRERSGENLHVGSERRSSKIPLIAMICVIAALGVTLATVQWGLASRSREGAMVYDCGLHPDRESAQALIDQLGPSVPTRVREQLDHFRLEVGPFADQHAAEAVRSQVWRVGACRAAPVALATVNDSANHSGG